MAELELTPEQRMVVDDRGGSLLVSAAAGSGKTKVLVDRLFRYVREDHANVDDFLIITYTKAAAAELRGKIATELSRRIAEAPEDTHLRGQLLRVYQADIKTVDAFCAGLLRENTHLLAREEDRRSLSPDFRTLDEEEAKLLRGAGADAGWLLRGHRRGRDPAGGYPGPRPGRSKAGEAGAGALWKDPEPRLASGLAAGEPGSLGGHDGGGGFRRHALR